MDFGTTIGSFSKTKVVNKDVKIRKLRRGKEIARMASTKKQI